MTSELRFAVTARPCVRRLVLVALSLVVPSAGVGAPQAADSARIQPPPSAGRAGAGPSSSVSADSLRLRFPTPAEASDYLSFTTADESVAFLRRMASVSPFVRLDSLIAREPSGEAASVPVVILEAPPAFAAVAHSPLPAVLVLAAQHGDEESGLDAALRLIRDVALGDLRPILDHLRLRVVPLVNAAGLEARTRVDGHGRDLNRDHLRLDSPVTAAIHRYLSALSPELVIDLHELGPVPYDVEIALPTHPDVDRALRDFGYYYLLPYVVNELARRDYTYHDYVEVPGPSSEEVTPGAGPAPPMVASASFTPASPEPSHARNAFGLEGAVSFLIEVSSTRDLDEYEERTNRQFVSLRALLEVGAAHADLLAATVAEARARTLEGAPKRVILRATPAPDPRHPVLTWRLRGPTGHIIIGESGPWLPRLIPELVIERPPAYVIEPHQEELLGVLLRHGMQVERLLERARLFVGRYPAQPPAPGLESAAEAPGVSVAPITWEWLDLPAGSLLVRTRQPGGGLLPVLLEPYSDGGWFTGPGSGGAPGDDNHFYPIVRLAEPYGGPTDLVGRPQVGLGAPRVPLGTEGDAAPR